MCTLAATCWIIKLNNGNSTSLGRNSSSKIMAAQYSGSLASNVNDFFRRLIPNMNESGTAILGGSNDGDLFVWRGV